VPGALGCGRGHRNGYASDLKEVPGELVHGVLDAHETLDYTAPLDVNRIDPSTRESEWSRRADAVGNRESVEHRADVFGMQLSCTSEQINFAAASRQRSCPKR